MLKKHERKTAHARMLDTRFKSFSSPWKTFETCSPVCSTASRNTTRQPVRLRETTYGHSDVNIHALLETVDNLKRNRLTDEDIFPRRVPFHFSPEKIWDMTWGQQWEPNILDLTTACALTCVNRDTLNTPDVTEKWKPRKHATETSGNSCAGLGVEK